MNIAGKRDRISVLMLVCSLFVEEEKDWNLRSPIPASTEASG